MPAYAPAMFMYWARGFAGQSATQSTAFAVIVRTVTSARRSLMRFTSNEPRGVLTKKFENPVGAVSGSIGGGVGVGAGVGRTVTAAVGAAGGAGVGDGDGERVPTAGAAIGAAGPVFRLASVTPPKTDSSTNAEFTTMPGSGCFSQPMPLTWV